MFEGASSMPANPVFITRDPAVDPVGEQTVLLMTGLYYMCAQCVVHLF